MVDVDLSMHLYTPKHTYKEMCVCKCVCVCHLTKLSHHNNQKDREYEKSWRTHKPRSQHDLSSCSVKVNIYVSHIICLPLLIDDTNMCNLHMEFFFFFELGTHHPARLNWRDMLPFIQTAISNGTLDHFI